MFRGSPHKDWKLSKENIFSASSCRWNISGTSSKAFASSCSPAPLQKVTEASSWLAEMLGLNQFFCICLYICVWELKLMNSSLVNRKSYYSCERNSSDYYWVKPQNQPSEAPSSCSFPFCPLVILESPDFQTGHRRVSGHWHMSPCYLSFWEPKSSVGWSLTSSFQENQFDSFEPSIFTWNKHHLNTVIIS